MRILFVITARGGSKGVPRKNITVLGKFPLIAYKIISAQKCKFDKRILVSTEDEEIAGVARKYGAEVPFLRPMELASDTASSIDVVMHAINWVKANDNTKYDCVCLLEPSSPFATYEDLDKAFSLMKDKNADTLLGMKETEVSSLFIHPLDMEGKLSIFYDSIRDNKSVRRQDQVKEYTMNGCIYAARMEYFIKNQMFHSINSIPYIMPQEKSIEIDSMLDYEFAKYLVDNRVVDISYWD